LAVVSTDLGAGTYQIPNCEEIGGDGGIIGKVGTFNIGETCIGQGQRYIVDVEPVNCEVDKGEQGVCSSHSCVQQNCDLVAANNEVLTMVTDSLGCPRCRNYSGALVDVFSCVTAHGVWGCGFPQPLEAMHQALNNNPENAGFLRENAYLGVLLITDSDDCSAVDPGLFDPSQDSVDSTLGYFSAFRCFEFGVSCDINDRTHVGVRQNCEPRNDPGTLLRPISRYVRLLRQLKDSQLLAVGGLAAPIDNNSVTVGRDHQNRPVLEPSCLYSTDTGPTPGVRLWAFVEAFAEEEEMEWAYPSMCDRRSMQEMGFGAVLTRIIDQLRIVRCLPAPLKGCADVGVEFGQPQHEHTCEINSRCLPECRVTDVFRRGTSTEQPIYVPPCLEVTADGTLSPGNTDRTVAYAGGHPNERDANLPVPTCWHIVFNNGCHHSGYAQLIISRRTDPPIRSFAEVTCRQIEQEEQICDDGKDNDEDCLVDTEDDDCR
jgi:hypothetical protein